MRVLFASSEVFPLVKTGGLGDVAGALPAALAAAGCDVRVLMPGYPEAMDGAQNKRQAGSLGDPLGLGYDTRLVSGRIPGSEAPVWLLDCPEMFARPGGPYQDEQGRDWSDNVYRFGLLSRAAALLAAEEGPVKWRPQILHCNDWQTGLAAPYLHASPPAHRPGTVFTIHNIAYQGQFPKETLPRLGLPWEMFTMDGLEYWDQVSFLKAGIVYSDRLTTVSPRYAKEIQSAPFGCGMEGVLASRASALAGILNGADYGVWNPAEDPHLDTRYRPEDFAAGKAANKAVIQRELGLAENPLAPLMVVVSRLNDHKGMDMVLAVLPALLKAGCQLAMVGTGERGLEDAFRAAAMDHPREIAVNIGYSESLAHRLMAAGDMLLMPSRSEPCGLTQFYAFRYGTLPVVHATGGLADTVIDTTYDSLMTGTANGFSFEHGNAGAFQWCIDRALALYRHPEQWKRVQSNAVRLDFSWERSAARYIDLYRVLSVRHAGRHAAHA